MTGRRAVITGIGLVSPCGNELGELWQALKEGRSGIGVLSRFDPTGFACKVGGQVNDPSISQLISPGMQRTLSHATQLGVAALRLALAKVRLDFEAPDRVALLVGSAIAGLKNTEQQFAVLFERGARRVNPFVANGSLPFATAGELAACAGARGYTATITTGCTASTQAIALGRALIESGEAEVVLAGGAESPLALTVFASMGRTMELARDDTDPARACRPFDRRHNGMVLSEGACFVVLEERERARQRGAHIWAEVLGGASSCDGQGLFHSDTTGATGGATVRQLLARLGLEAKHVSWLCAHANASPVFDLKETTVAKAAFGEWAPRIPVSSIKAVLGHPFGAAGAFQVAAACLAFQHQMIPPTHFLEEPAEGCDLDYVPQTPRPAPVEHVLVSSYGYGGVNSYLLLRHPEA